jgi:Zn-dependent M28 family amino/carboxypeptidase
VLLCAHWDTRPFADQDIKDQDKPILGANDGASGVGVLLEIAAVLKKQPVEIGVDIVLFDAEDWGDNSGAVENSYCLGSQFWAKNPHVPSYKADFGILLDMVGAPNAVFGFEGYSLAEAQTYLSMVWSSANNAGYSGYFKNFERGYVTDDHVYVMKHLKIPMIDIIDCDLNTSSHFGKYWHTHADNMNAIDKNTLKAVGQTLLDVISAY